jgi:tetratricopeptide (TPR) repeat protein
MKAIKNILIAAIVAAAALAQPNVAEAQMSEYKFNQLFDQAFKLTLVEDYQQAFPIWKQLVRADQDHGQVLYFYSVCRTKTGGSTAQNTSALSRAVQKVDYYNQPGRVEDRSAPVKAWYHLAEAYAEREDFDAAVEAYRNYMSCIPLASIDHKREVIDKIKAAKENKKLVDLYGTVSLIANQKP